MNTFLWILVLVAALAGLTLALNLPREVRVRRLAKSRDGSNAFADFRAALPELPDDLCRSVYDALQALVPGRDFPVRADDDLSRTLEVDQGSLDDVIERLLGDGEKVPAGRLPPIVTAGDLARAAWRSRRQPPTWPNGEDS